MRTGQMVRALVLAVGIAAGLPFPQRAEAQVRAGSGPTISRVSPVRLELAADGTPGQVIVTGTGIERFTRPIVEIDRRASQDVRATARYDARLGMTVILEASAAVAGRPATLILSDGSQRLEVTGLTLTVGKGAERMPETTVVQTSRLTMTGLSFDAISLFTAPLTMTGLSFDAISLFTAPLTMTGLSFEPVTVPTSPLTMTGLAFEPAVVFTPPLTMRGIGENPR